MSGWTFALASSVIQARRPPRRLVEAVLVLVVAGACVVCVRSGRERRRGVGGRTSSPFEPDASSHAERITHYTTPPHTTQLATMQAHHVIKPPTAADIPKAHELEVLSYPEVSKCLICVYGVRPHFVHPLSHSDQAARCLSSVSIAGIIMKR